MEGYGKEARCDSVCAGCDPSWIIRLPLCGGGQNASRDCFWRGSAGLPGGNGRGGAAVGCDRHGCERRRCDGQPFDRKDLRNGRGDRDRDLCGEGRSQQCGKDQQDAGSQKRGGQICGVEEIERKDR